jgi:threonine dehydratase
MGAQLQGQRVGVILSGGNIDMPRFCALLQAAPV